MTSTRQKAVCAACRARKKKCDGEQPACSACLKRKIYCSYVPSPTPMSSGITLRGPDLSSLPMDWEQSGAASLFSSTAIMTNPATEPPSTTTSVNPWDTLLLESLSSSSADFALQYQPSFDLPPEGWAPSLSDNPETAISSPQSDLFPPHQRIVELVDLFFSRVQWYLPLFHQQSFTTAISSGELASRCPLLIYAVMTLAARAHANPDIREHQQEWFNKAKALYEVTSHVPEPALETLQAAICIVLHALTRGDHATAMFVLGKAWRQTVALGLHQLDSPSRILLPGLTLPPTSDWQDTEQRRRIVWTLFILDRGMYFPTGFTHTIDDRQLRVFLPVSESGFQDSEAPPNQSDVPQFSSDPKKLIARMRNPARGKTTNLLQYLVLAYFLLGRIVEHMFSPDYDQKDSQIQSERALLEELLAQARLILPRSATDLAAASHTDFGHVVWLKVIMDVNTIFLYHRPSIHLRGCAQAVEPVADANTEDTDSWQRCVAAARSTALLIREASGISTNLIMNPLVAAPIFTCARILSAEYLLSSPKLQVCGSSPRQQPQRRAGLRVDLEVMLLIFSRLDETFGGAFHKFRVGLLYHLHSDLAGIQSVKAGGSRGLLLSCRNWPTEQDVEDMEGIPD